MKRTYDEEIERRLVALTDEQLRNIGTAAVSSWNNQECFSGEDLRLEVLAELRAALALTQGSR